MHKVLLSCLLGACTLQGMALAEQGVQVTADEAHQRVDITIDGKPFTSYLWSTGQKKPVLFPLICAGWNRCHPRNILSRLVRASVSIILTTRESGSTTVT